MVLPSMSSDPRWMTQFAPRMVPRIKTAVPAPFVAAQMPLSGAGNSPSQVCTCGPGTPMSTCGSPLSPGIASGIGALSTVVPPGFDSVESSQPKESVKHARRIVAQGVFERCIEGGYGVGSIWFKGRVRI